MITAIEIENFKGIRDRVRIELKPITLLFGPNSAGKSTILQALQYAAEILERRNLNAGLIGDGAAGVDLGGFQNFVHGHNANKDVVLGFSVNIGPGETLPTFGSRTLRDVDDPDTLFGIPASVRVELTIGWSNLLDTAVVSRYAVTLNGVAFAEIRFEPGSPHCELSLNERHPIFIKNGEHSSLALWHPLDAEVLGEETVIKQLLDWAVHTRAISGLGPGQYGLLGRGDALPDFDRPLSFDADWDWVNRDPQLQSARLPELADYLTVAISQLVLGPGRLLCHHLVNARFLGPIREVPQRNHTTSRQQERGRWSSGLGAWDRLETADRGFVDKVSDWLGDENRLNSGYQLRAKRFKELDLGDRLVVQLLTGRAFDEAEAGAKLDLNKLPTQTRLLIVPTDRSIELRPSDVGIGISQVVPVIVTALDGASRTVSIEQPELHLHPRLQAELGDLFVESAKGQSKHVVILETHSEHLILRILRRIRETGEGKPHNGVPLTGDDVAVYYVNVELGCTQLRKIDIDKKGDFVQPWPDDFFEIDFYERFA